MSTDNHLGQNLPPRLQILPAVRITKPTGPATPDAGHPRPGATVDRTPVATAAERHRIEVEWHAASQGYVHRILDAHTGHQISQTPAAQVLQVVADLMDQIRNS